MHSAEDLATDPRLRMVAEALRDLRTNLLFTDDTIRSIVVTSPDGSHGKTTVAFGLAATLARSGTRTLLIDADLRRGRIAELLSPPRLARADRRPLRRGAAREGASRDAGRARRPRRRPARGRSRRAADGRVPRAARPARAGVRRDRDRLDAADPDQRREDRGPARGRDAARRQGRNRAAPPRPHGGRAARPDLGQAHGLRAQPLGRGQQRRATTSGRATRTRPPRSSARAGSRSAAPPAAEPVLAGRAEAVAGRLRWDPVEVLGLLGLSLVAGLLALSAVLRPADRALLVVLGAGVVAVFLLRTDFAILLVVATAPLEGLWETGPAGIPPDQGRRRPLPRELRPHRRSSEPGDRLRARPGARARDPRAGAVLDPAGLRQHRRRHHRDALRELRDRLRDRHAVRQATGSCSAGSRGRWRSAARSPPSSGSERVPVRQRDAGDTAARQPERLRVHPRHLAAADVLPPERLAAASARGRARSDRADARPRSCSASRAAPSSGSPPGFLVFVLTDRRR